MHDPTFLIASSMHWISDLSESTTLQLSLLIGSGLLAVALLVLSLTKWGQARPVWKCVVLSIVAHILLMGYAYGTHLIFQAPAVVQETPPVKINLIEESEDDLADAQPEPEEPVKFEEFTNDQLLPEINQLERPAIDSEMVIEREIAETTTDVVASPEFELPDIQTDTQPALPVETNQFQPEESVVDAEEIEVDRRMEDAPPEQFPAFETSEFERQEIANRNAPEATEIPKPFIGELESDEAPLPFFDDDLPERAPTTNATRLASKTDIAQPRTQMRQVSTQKRIGDGKPLPDLYSLRAADNRLSIAESRGGSVETEQSVRSALQWLANNQEEDGRWSSQRHGGGVDKKVFGHDRNGAGAEADTGITALAVMAFMAGGHTHLDGKYRENVQRGLEYLLRNQAADGNFHGRARFFARTYCHSMSLLALSEALAITGDSRLIAGVQRGINFSVYAQNKNDGGWRYQPGDPGDMSQFGWQVLAMHSAKAGGIYVPKETVDGMQAFLQSCSSGVGGGLASYRPKQQVSTTMTAEALVCRYFLQENVGDNTKQQATTRVLRELPSEHHINLYYWYYGTMAMYQTGGEAWQRWNERLKEALTNTQIKRGAKAGSWEPNGLWAGYGGRVYSTAMATLCLEVYYRYLPMYEVAEVEAARQLLEQMEANPDRQAGRIIQLR